MTRLSNSQKAISNNTLQSIMLGKKFSTCETNSQTRGYPEANWDG